MIAVHRDQERGESYQGYLSSFIEYLRDSSEKNSSSLRQAAEEVDSVIGGYNTERTCLAKTLDKRVELLRKGDKITWLRLLCGLRSVRDNETDFYKEVLKLSPFLGHSLTNIRYGYGFMMDNDSRGHLLEMVHNELRRVGIKPFNAGDYAIVLPEEKLEEMRKLLESAEIHKID